VSKRFQIRDVLSSRPTGSERSNRPAVPLVSLCVEPPAGIEPATPSLPWNHREPLCATPFSQVTPDRRRRSYRFSFGQVMRSQCSDWGHCGASNILLVDHKLWRLSPSRPWHLPGRLPTIMLPQHSISTAPTGLTLMPTRVPSALSAAGTVGWPAGRRLLAETATSSPRVCGGYSIPNPTSIDLMAISRATTRNSQLPGHPPRRTGRHGRWSHSPAVRARHRGWR
jgi:hypothetical protein